MGGLHSSASASRIATTTMASASPQRGNDAVLTEFAVDETLMELFTECMDNYGQVLEGHEDAEWPNNVISNRLVIYGDGLISKRDEPVAPSHRVSAAELQVCKRISQQLAGRCTQEVGMGSESSDSVFLAFYMAAQLPESGSPNIPTEITEEMIKSKFSETIFPLATVTVEPMEPEGAWWEAVCADGEGAGAGYLEPWHDMINAFNEHPELRAPVFVMIGGAQDMVLDEDEFPEGTEMMGSVLPRMALALTAGGSIVGLFGDVTQT